MTDADKPALLIVDDDPLITDTLSYVLGREFAVTAVASRAQAAAWLATTAQPPALAVVDLGLPPFPHRPDEGFALIGDLLAHAADMRIIVLSGQNDEANARHARTLGAMDFVAKPADPDHLRTLLRQALSLQPPELAVRPPGAADDLVGDSLPMQKLRAQLRQYANSPFPVLVEGESGSGKEIIAASLHRLSGRSARPYLALNCAAISPALVEPTLFGHAKGAFTGAAGARSGYFEEAAEGTLFLDEIGELPLDLQPKLLRVLENGAYQRVGETNERLSRARIVAATNRDLRREVREGRFRADLYHRLSVFSVIVPPLRDMNGDRFLLLDHFKRLYAEQAGLPPFSLSEEARERWRAYGFPGNVRELRNIVIRLVTKYPGRTLGVDAIDAELDPLQCQPLADKAMRQPHERLAAALEHLRIAEGSFSLDETLQAWEAAYIEAAQQLAQGNISQAARLLGVNRTTLYNRMEALSRGRGRG